MAADSLVEMEEPEAAAGIWRVRRGWGGTRRTRRCSGRTWRFRWLWGPPWPRCHSHTTIITVCCDRA